MGSVDIKLIANIIGLIGSVLMVFMGLLKKKKDVIFTQNIQLLLLGFSNVLVGGYSGSIATAMGLFRNILYSKGKLNMFWIIIIMIASITTGVIFNEEGPIGYLPIIATIIFLLFMNLKDMVKFKMMMAVVMFLWFIYDMELGLFTTSLFDLITVFSCLVSMYHIAHEKPGIVKRKRRGRRKSKSK